MIAGGRCLGGKQSSDRPRTDQETENVDQDDICAVGRHCSEHRRYSIGCDQETKSPSQRPTGSGHRPTHRPTFQSLQSRGHRRWYPWLQSNARALLNCLSIKRPSPEIWPETISDSEEVLARKWGSLFLGSSFRKNLSDSRGEAPCVRGIVPFTHLTREGRMTVTIGRRELLAALGGAAARA